MTHHQSLLEIAHIHPSDKIITYGHNYIPGYSTLFDPKRYSAKNVLEIGIGCLNHETAMRTISNYRYGNSLRMWRDFFENATIYGIDIHAAGMMCDEPRITTILADQYYYR